MATVNQCRVAIDVLADRLHATDPHARKSHIPRRTVELALMDLDFSFNALLENGDLTEIREGTVKKPQIRLAMSSDDLIQLTEGRLNFAHAWASGRIRLNASFRDLLKLRALL